MRAKSEIRIPKTEGNPKSESRMRTHRNGLSGHRLRALSDFGLPSGFGFRHSDFRAAPGWRTKLWLSFGRAGRLLQESPDAPGERPAAEPMR